jgi:hypothetical protein
MDNNLKRKYFSSFFILPFLLIAAVAILVYHPAFGVFFTQDDFTHFKISQAKTLKEFLYFFLPQKGVIFYRPLSVQIYTWICHLLFGLNPFGFHLVAFIFHLINIYLVWYLIMLLTKNPSCAFLIAFFWGVSSIHFMSLFWIAEFSLVLVSFFFFLSFIFYLKGKYWRFLLLFLLGLLSNELMVTLPVILLIYELLFKKSSLVKLIPPAIAVIVFISLRFFLFTTLLGEYYRLNFTIKQLTRSLRWYTLRLINLPEGIKFFLFLEKSAFLSFCFSCLFVFFFLILPLLFFKTKKPLNWRIIILGTTWFFLSLTPVIFMSQHQSPLYASLGLPGFFLCLGEIFQKFTQDKVQKYLTLGAIFSFFLTSFFSVRLMQKHHWVTKRAQLAKRYLTLLQKYHLELIQKQTVYFKNQTPDASKELYFAFAGPTALQIFFNQPNLQVLFEDFDSPPGKEALIILVASE